MAVWMNAAAGATRQPRSKDYSPKHLSHKERLVNFYPDTKRASLHNIKKKMLNVVVISPSMYFSIPSSALGRISFY